MSMDTEESLKEYLQAPAEVPLLARIGPLARTLDFVANAAPGVKEILTVGKFALGGAGAATTTSSWSTPPPPATSSASSRAPQAINELVQVGLVREQTGWMLDILSDPARPASSSWRRPRRCR